MRNIITFIIALLVLSIFVYLAISIAAIVFFLVIPIALLLIAKDRNKGKLRILPDQRSKGVKFRFKTKW